MGLFSSPAWTDVVFWALDLETTGLDPRTGAILSVGMVPVRGGSIRWGEQYYSLVRPAPGWETSIDAMRVHHILPAEVATAPDLPEVLGEIARRLAEGALLVHYGRLDVGFLKHACKSLRRPWRAPPLVDTVKLIGRLDRRRMRLEPYAESRPTSLVSAREAMALPAHVEHHALFDALATAELFLALRSRLGARTLQQLR